MDNYDEQITQRLEARLGRIEQKLDTHLAQASKQEADIAWVKGYIKLSFSALIAVATGLISTAIKVFVKS